jgi:hypothetical protein
MVRSPRRQAAARGGPQNPATASRLLLLMPLEACRKGALVPGTGGAGSRAPRATPIAPTAAGGVRGGPAPAPRPKLTTPIDTDLTSACEGLRAGFETCSILSFSVPPHSWIRIARILADFT